MDSLEGSKTEGLLYNSLDGIVSIQAKRMDCYIIDWMDSLETIKTDGLLYNP